MDKIEQKQEIVVQWRYRYIFFNYLQLRAASNQSNSNSSGMTNGTSGGIQIGSRTSGTRDTLKCWKD